MSKHINQINKRYGKATSREAKAQTTHAAPSKQQKTKNQINHLASEAIGPLRGATPVS